MLPGKATILLLTTDLSEAFAGLPKWARVAAVAVALMSLGWGGNEAFEQFVATPERLAEIEDDSLPVRVSTLEANDSALFVDVRHLDRREDRFRAFHDSVRRRDQRVLSALSDIRCLLEADVSPHDEKTARDCIDTGGG